MCCSVDIDKSSFNNAAAEEFRPVEVQNFFSSVFFYKLSLSLDFGPDPNHKSFSLQIESNHFGLSGLHL